MRSSSHALGGVSVRAMLLLCGFIALAPVSARVAAQELSLSDALLKVVAADPVAQANNAHLAAARAGIGQANVRPRDIVGVDIEDFVGTGPYSSLGRSQSTGWYERTWERGGKREARVAAAEADVGVVAQRSRLRRLDRMATVQESYVEAQAAQAFIPVVEANLTSALAVQAEVNRRVAAALDPMFAAERARTTVAEARIAVDQARETARLANARLAAWWSGSGDFQPSMASFFDVKQPGFDTGTPGGGPDQPELALLAAAQQVATTRVQLAESGNVADPQARVGLRYFSDGSDAAVMVGGSIPLGSRAANRGNVVRAQAEQAAAEAEIAVARHDLELESRQLQADRELAAAEVARIEGQVIPSAERALALVRAGFARGGTAFTFLEISQAQRTLNDARARRVELLRRFHLTGARLDRLSGRHLSLMTSEETR